MMILGGFWQGCCQTYVVTRSECVGIAVSYSIPTQFFSAVRSKNRLTEIMVSVPEISVG